MKLSKLSALTASAAMLFLVSSCGQKAADAAVLGLSAPASVNIVNETSSSTAAVSAAMSSSYSGTAGLSAAFNSSGTDYSTQRVDTWIKSATGSVMLAEVNYFLCVLKFANLADYPNKTYRAQYNAKLCYRPSDGKPLFGEGPVNREILIQTERSSATAPYNQTMWFKVPYRADGFNKEWDYVMDMTVTESPTTANPLGLFTFKFAAVRATDPDGTTYTSATSKYNGVVKVYSEGGKNYLSFLADYAIGGGADTYSSMIIELDGSGGLSGMALMDSPDWDDFPSRKLSKVNFNADYMNEQSGSGGDEICTSLSGMSKNVWDYKMFYKDTGKVLNMNGGFNVTYGATAKRGWASRYGLWTNNTGDTPSTVTRKKDSAVFNVIRAGGKLVKKTKGMRTLATNEELRYWTGGTEYKVKWNGSTFVSLDTVEGYGAALIKLNAADDDGNAQWPWSRRLNQNVKYTGTEDIVYWSEEVVRPWNTALAGGDLSFTCYGFCPQGEVSQTLADVIDWDEDAVKAVEASAFSTTGKAYTFDSTNMLLKYSGTDTPVVLDPSLSSSVDSRFFMKLTLPGSLVPSPHWRVTELDVHYQWQSGTQDWNKSINFKNQSTNAWYEFSAPVKFDYTHLTTNDLNNDETYNNINYYLEYDGGLSGIPNYKLANGIYVREFSIKNGDVFNGKAKQLGRDLVLKATNIQKDPVTAVDSSCSALRVNAVALTLPDSTATISVSKTWAQRLEVTGASDDYLIIDGVVQ